MVLTSDGKLWYLSDKKLDTSNRKYSRRTLNIITKDLLAKSYNSGLNISNLADGVYSITENMVKVDKTTASMSDAAINHTIKLTVKNGKYYITLNFNGLTVGQKLGYLSQLKYFTTGYTLDKYGNLQGTLADVTVTFLLADTIGRTIAAPYEVSASIIMSVVGGPFFIILLRRSKKYGKPEMQGEMRSWQMPGSIFVL